MKSKVSFADKGIEKAWRNLENYHTEDMMLSVWISRAIRDLEENAFCGIQIRKRLIPKDYLDKYRIDNLWKYDMPKWMEAALFNCKE